MKITFYELLGLVKDGKAPKKIKFGNIELEYDEKCEDYYSYYGQGYYGQGLFEYKFENCKNFLNDEVEIIEEPKKIEKENLFKLDASMSKASLVAWQKANNGIIKNKIDELIDEINNLKEND